MGLLDDFLDEKTIDSISEAMDSVSYTVRKSGNALLQGAGDALAMYVDGPQATARYQRYPFIFIIGNYKLNWRDSILITRNNELKYVCEPSARDKKFHILDDKGYRAAVVTLGKSSFFSSTYNRIGILAVDKDFYFEVDFSKIGMLLEVEELTIMSPKKNEIIVKNGGEEVIRIEKMRRAWTIGTLSPQYESLAMGLAVGYDLYKKLQ